MTPDKIHHGSRYDIPSDVWEALLETVREIKALSPKKESAVIPHEAQE